MTDTPSGNQRRGLDFPAVPADRALPDLDRFWDDWEPLIRRVASAKLRTARVPRSLASADDAVQHAFLQLRERWQEPDFLDVDPGRYCVGSVLPDYVRQQVKELKNRAGQLGTDPLSELEAPEPGPEELLIQQEVERYLRDALQHLPEKQRLAVELTVEGELSRDQVAKRIGVPSVGTVSSHRTRGLSKLADILGPIVMSIGQLIDMARHATDLFRHLF